MVRWDSPLFTVLWSDEDVPGNDIWTAVTEGFVKAPNAGTSAVAVAPTDALHTLEQTSTAMVTAIMSEQANNAGLGGPILVKFGDVNTNITLPPRSVSLSELQRLKRQFVTIHKKAITLGTVEKGAVDWNEERIADKFVTYLQETMKS